MEREDTTAELLQRTTERADNTAALLRRESVPQGVDIGAAQATYFVKPEREVDPDALDGIISGDEVVWAPNDPDHPHNWPNSMRWRIVGIVSALSFLSPLSSTLIAPAVDQIELDLGYSSDILSTMAVVAFVLCAGVLLPSKSGIDLLHSGYAVGPIFISPISEVFGRSPVYHSANICWIVLTIIAARSVNIGMLIAFRFLTGLCGAVPMTLFGGTVADLFHPRERGKATYARPRFSWHTSLKATQQITHPFGKLDCTSHWSCASSSSHWCRYPVDLVRLLTSDMT